MSEAVLKWVQFVSIMLYVLVAGVMWGTWLSLARTMTNYDAATFRLANIKSPAGVLLHTFGYDNIRLIVYQPIRAHDCFGAGDGALTG